MQLDQLVGDAFGKLLWQLLPFLACALAIAFLKALAPGRRRRKLASKGVAKTPLAPTLAELEYKRKLEGVAGELKVRRLIEHRYAHSLHDIYLPYRNGTTQIDHVVLIGDRIVVVETKNYSHRQAQLRCHWGEKSLSIHAKLCTSRKRRTRSLVHTRSVLQV